jgi:hypothetical protein
LRVGAPRTGNLLSPYGFQRQERELGDKSGDKSRDRAASAAADISGAAALGPGGSALALLSRLGNPRLQRLLRAGVVQPRLRIGQPDDPREQEADRLAERVMRMPESVRQEARFASAAVAPGEGSFSIGDALISGGRLAAKIPSAWGGRVRRLRTGWRAGELRPRIGEGRKAGG